MSNRSEPSAEPAARVLVITRVFDAPRALVFQAWTDAGRLARWWGPRGFTNPVCECDARPGGELRIVMRAPDGATYPMRGVFREVVAPDRLVFTNVALAADGSTLIDGLTTVTFAEHDGKTTLTVQSRAVAMTEAAAAMIQGMDAGWSQSLDRLGEHMADPGATPG